MTDHTIAQPLPITGSIPIREHVIRDVRNLAMFRNEESVAIVADINAVLDRGEAKYGQPLSTMNGRDQLVDAYQEALDCQNYLKALTLEHPFSGNYKRMYWNAQALVFDLKEALEIRG